MISSSYVFEVTSKLRGAVWCNCADELRLSSLSIMLSQMASKVYDPIQAFGIGSIRRSIIVALDMIDLHDQKP
jgi:hypothetical protein